MGSLNTMCTHLFLCRQECCMTVCEQVCVYMCVQTHIDWCLYRDAYINRSNMWNFHRLAQKCVVVRTIGGDSHHLDSPEDCCWEFLNTSVWQKPKMVPKVFWSTHQMKSRHWMRDSNQLPLDYLLLSVQVSRRHWQCWVPSSKSPTMSRKPTSYLTNTLTVTRANQNVLSTLG